MNTTQLRRWKRVSAGLAKNAYPNITAARRQLLINEIDSFIDTVTYNFDLDEIRDWDGNSGNCHVCDELSEFLWNNRYEFERRRNGWVDFVPGKFGHDLSCCIRAGFDVAVSPSAGVLGYTVGDLRRVFPSGLPAWVMSRFDAPHLLAAADDHDEVWL